MPDIPIFKDIDYPIEPFKHLNHYVDQQYQHLRRIYPTVPAQELKRIIKGIAKKNYKEPQLQRVSFPSPGHHHKEVVPLSQHLTDITGNITAPNGNTYCQPSLRESLIRLTIIENVAQRSAFKKEMFKAEQNGDTHGQTIFNNLQTTKKISNNSTPGAMQSMFNILSDKSGFNAITSTTRLGVKTAYGTVERLFAGNIYLPTFEDALSYIYNTISVMPKNTEAVLQKYKGKIRYVERKDFLDWIVSNMQWYAYRSEYLEDITRVVDRLTPLEMTYIYYAGSWYNLFNYNTEYFRGFVDGVFDRNIAIDPSIKADDIWSLEETMSVMVRGTNSELFGRDEKGALYNLNDAIKYNPEGIRQIVAYAHHMDRYMRDRADLLDVFLKTRNETPQPFFNHRLVRKATILCDTDSNLFTANELVRLYHGLPAGKTDFSDRSFDVTALSVYILCMTLEHTFARYSSRAGIVGKDTGIISMKNEFLYPVFMRTNIGKHYSGEIKIQEGNILRTPKLDMKGVGYVGSIRPKEITDAVRSFMSNFFDEVVQTNGELSAETVLTRVAGIESKILDSLNRGEKTYLGGVTIKQPGSYKDNGERSCFYYRVWEEVFADHFGIRVVLPNRMMKIPLIGDDDLWSNPEMMDPFREAYPDVFKRMMQFRKNNPNKKINYLIAPSSMGGIPDMFRPWINKRTVISSMCSPFYLALQSLNLDVAIPDKDVLVMDYVDGVLGNAA